MTRRTSIYTLSFTAKTGQNPVRVLDFTCHRAVRKGLVLTGSGTDPRAYVMFRASSDDEAIAFSKDLCFNHLGTPLFHSQALTTGQGTHTRNISLEGTNTMSTATKYDVYLSADGTFLGQRARKDAAIKLGEQNSREQFEVRSSKTGEVVYTSTVAEGTAPVAEAPAPADTNEESTVTEKTETKPKKAAAKKAVSEPAAEEREGTEIEFEGLGKYYAKCAGLHGAEVIGAVYGVEASIKGTTITLYGSDEDVETVAGWLQNLWPAAKLAHREYRKADKVYSAISKDRKDADANAQRWDLEVKWFTEFMNGAADELAGTAKRKGGAYKDGVNAVQNPAEPEATDEAADVI